MNNPQPKSIATTEIVDDPNGSDLSIAFQARLSILEMGSDTDCDYWRYCAIDGFLCSCCGGSANPVPRVRK